MGKVNKLYMDVIYFLLTVLFFYTQLHIAIEFAWQKSISLSTLILALLFLKIGEAFHEFFDAGSIRMWILMAAFASIVIIFNPHYLFFFIFGLSMMKVRSTVAKYSSKKVKIVARTLGFLVAPLSSKTIYLSYVIILFVACLLYRDLGQIKLKLKLYVPKIKVNFPVYWTMGLHHAHYFAYAYTIPYLFSIRTDIPYWLMGLIFYIGWAAYNAYEWFLKPKWRYFMFGHIIALIALVGLYYSNNDIGISFWWFMTGLGGGTVYMLHSFLIDQEKSSSREMLIAEGIGHVSGILAWGLTSLFLSLEYTLIVGAILAFATTAMAIYSKNKSLNKVHVMEQKTL
ncbi:hypothetical protein [Anoxybacteroides tepidamans]|uniref:hypothetical protein n=1 Tax=Anoxybacteroides tepidamans TaxID=265948 RepID=UPI000480E981|nr:hypothetical protein [Anoxybacillus tepidamans]